mmetsp:Transcript_55748/g.136570  ORF Transcript_55748/g.136570 Transcript_55748/m.136570 type:complete len:226 (+) Transcript_55748:53-730(+)
MDRRGLLYVLFLLASALDVPSVHAQQAKCWDAEVQAGSGPGAPCRGYVYRGKVCSPEEQRVTFMASVLGSIIDSNLTPDFCQRSADDLCKEISPNARAQQTTCEDTCLVLQAGALTTCADDEDCAAGETTLDQSELIAGVDGFVASAYANLCCSHVEKTARLQCTGFTDAEIVAYMDAATDSMCSTKPTCIYPSQLSHSAQLRPLSPPLAALTAAAAALASWALL